MPSGPRNTEELAAASLASGSTIAAAAKLAGVSTGTIFRWKRDPAFCARVSELRSAAVAAALGLLSEGMAEAATALVALVRHKNADTRFRAAVKVLELALRVRDQTDIAERLEAVERQLRGANNVAPVEKPNHPDRNPDGDGDRDGAT